MQSTPEVGYARSFALVAGVTYRGTSLKALPNAESDARCVGDTLDQECGFKVVTIPEPEATADRIFNTFMHIGMNSKRNDRILLYLSGHGDVREKRSEVGYFLPVDADVDNPRSWLWWHELIVPARLLFAAKHIFLAFDTCYSGVALQVVQDLETQQELQDLRDVQRAHTADTLRIRDWHLKADLNHRCVPVLTSAGKGLAFDGPEGTHSVFARAFLDVLQGKVNSAREGTVIKGSRLAEYVTSQVDGLEQRVQFSPGGYGDFVFKGFSTLTQEVDETTEPETWSFERDVTAQLKRLIDSDYVAQVDQEVASTLTTAVERLRAAPTGDGVRHALNRLDVGLTDLVAVQTTLGYYGKNHKTITSAPLRLWHEVPNRYAPIAAFYAAGVAATAAENYQTLFSLCEAPAPGAVRRAPFVSRAAEYFVSVNDQLVAEESDSSRLALSDRLHATLRSIHDRVLRLETNFDLAFDRFEALWWLQNADHAADKEGVVSQALPPPGRFAAAAGTSFVEELIEEARHAEGSRWPPLTAGLCGGKRDRFTRLAEHLINAIEEFLTLRLVIKARPALPWEVQIAQSKTLDSLWAKILWSPEWPDSQERTRSVLFGVAGIQPRYVLVDERSLPAYATAAHESRRHALIVAATEGETSISRTSTLSLKECGLENGATLVVCDRETGLPATFAEERT